LLNKKIDRTENIAKIKIQKAAIGIGSFLYVNAL
jgi:hypothetical protein